MMGGLVDRNFRCEGSPNLGSMRIKGTTYASTQQSHSIAAGFGRCVPAMGQVGGRDLRRGRGQVRSLAYSGRHSTLHHLATEGGPGFSDPLIRWKLGKFNSAAEGPLRSSSLRGSAVHKNLGYLGGRSTADKKRPRFGGFYEE
jgi:hypothetical protein